MRVGLVLGAGGVMGGAWLTGGLHALASETRWDPGSADHIVGTSAGALMAALVAGGVPPWFMVAHSAGETFDGIADARGRPARDADRSGGARFAIRHPWWPVPGSWRLALSALARPDRQAPAALFAGLAPRGPVCTAPLVDTVRRAVGTRWAPHPNLWIVACDYADGRRTAFGRAGSPPADLASAVAASCAIPGFDQPVRIGGRLFVDGGIHSTSNLDLLTQARLDLVICLNPTSSLHPTRGWNPAERVAGMMRGVSGRRLGREARLLRAAGTEVVLIQPTAEDLAVIGPNLMSRRRRNEVIATARRTVAGQLRRAENRRRLEALPEGRPEAIERPAGPPSSWPRFADAAVERFGRAGRMAAAGGRAEAEPAVAGGGTAA